MSLRSKATLPLVALLACAAFGCAIGESRQGSDDGGSGGGNGGACADVTACSPSDGCCPTGCEATDVDCCAATFELCNGIVDDACTAVDEGCPTGVSTGAPVSCGCAFGGPGGDAFTRACPAGSVLVGFDGTDDARLTRLRPACAPLVFTAGDGSTEDSFTVGTGTVTLLANAGLGEDGVDFSDRCPANQVVIGISGREFQEIEAFQFTCGTIAIGRVAPGGAWQVTVTETVDGAYHGGTAETPYEYPCPAGSVATAFSGRAGDRVDGVSLSCSPVTMSVL